MNEEQRAALRADNRRSSAQTRKRDNSAKPRFGGTIPSPKQMTMEEARKRSLMGRSEMAPMVPKEPTFGDIPNMSPEEIEQYNRPAMDINDAFFGDINPVEYLRRLFGGR